MSLKSQPKKIQYPKTKKRPSPKISFPFRQILSKKRFKPKRQAIVERQKASIEVTFSHFCAILHHNHQVILVKKKKKKTPHPSQKRSQSIQNTVIPMMMSVIPNPHRHSIQPSGRESQQIRWTRQVIAQSILCAPKTQHAVRSPGC